MWELSLLYPNLSFSDVDFKDTMIVNCVWIQEKSWNFPLCDLWLKLFIALLASFSQFILWFSWVWVLGGYRPYNFMYCFTWKVIGNGEGFLIKLWNPPPKPQEKCPPPSNITFYNLIYGIELKYVIHNC